MFEKPLIVFIDAQECRRVAFANLFSSLLSEKNVFVLNFASVADIKSTQSELDLMGDAPPLFILNIGGQSLDTPDVVQDVSRLRRMMPECLVLIMQEVDWTGSMEVAIAQGVQGIISMTMPPRNAVAAIEVALMGGTFFPRPASCGRQIGGTLTAIAQNPHENPSRANFSGPKTALPTSKAVQERVMSADRASTAQTDPVQLSKRQIDVAKALESGMSNKEIARALKLSEATIKIHVRNLMRKYGVGNRTQVAVLSKHGGAAEVKANFTNWQRFSL